MITYSRKVFIPLTRLCRDRCALLHVRHRARPAGQPVPVAGRGARDRPAGRRAGLQGGPVHPRATGPRTAGTQAREWLDAHGYDDTLSYVRAMAIRVLEETGLLPHLNPGVMSWQDFQRLKPVAPSMGMMLETTAERLFTEQGRAALRSPGQGPGGPAAGAGGRRPQRRPVHHRHPDRHRRDPRRARRVAVRDPPGRPRVRRHPGSHRAELPGQAGHRDARARPTPSWTTWPPRSRWPGWCSARRSRIQAPPNLIDATSTG